MSQTITIKWVKVFKAAEQQDGKGLFSHRIYHLFLDFPYLCFWTKSLEVLSLFSDHNK